MSPPVETVVTSIPASESERLLVVLLQSPEGGSRMELRQQSFSRSMGWFTQSTVALEPTQVAALRNALGSRSAGRAAGRANLPREFASLKPQSWQPKVVHADSA